MAGKVPLTRKRLAREIRSRPYALERPVNPGLEMHQIEGCDFVFFDLETTGLWVKRRTPDILQLSAIQGEKTFNKYVRPKLAIEESATRVNGISYENDTLFVHGRPETAIKIKACLEAFLTFLRQCNRPILVAHNGKDFDVCILMRSILRNSLEDEFKEVVVGFLDSLEIFREVVPHVRSHKLPDLARRYFPVETCNFHDAKDDAACLKKLFNHAHVSNKTVKKYAFSFRFAKQYYTYKTSSMV